MDSFNDENVATDVQIQLLIEKFEIGFANLMHHPEHDPMSRASSPPTILKKSFKRSVSAVFADSGIAENGNLLFFPSGVPLLDEEGEIDIDGDSPDSAHGRHGLAGRDGSSADNVKAGSAFEESSSTVDYSPSLVAADIILQLEGELVMTNPMTKKVTLRPKMNAPNNNNRSSFHSPSIADLFNIAKNIPPIININPPNTNAVMYHLLAIILLNKSLKPLGVSLLLIFF